MTNRQENKNSMYYAVTGICSKHEKIWIVVPAFTKAHSVFNEYFQEIQQVNEIQLTNTTGITKDKQKQEAEMIAKTLLVSSNLFAYASMADNQGLKSRVDCSPSILKRMPDTELKNQCSMVLKAGYEFADALVDFGTSVEDLKALGKEITDYENILAAPREAVATKSTATAKLDELFAQADKVLKEQIDKMMTLFQVKTPDFYREYHNARKIIDLGVRHRKEKAL